MCGTHWTTLISTPRVISFYRRMTPHVSFWESLYNVTWTPPGLFHYAMMSPFHRGKIDIVLHVNNTIRGISLYWWWIALSDQNWLSKCRHSIPKRWTQPENVGMSWEVSPFSQDNGLANACIQYQWDSITRCEGVILQREISNRRVLCYILK